MDMRRREWLKIALVSVLVAACIFITVWFLFVVDEGFLFPNLYYIPIILACLWWDRKGIALAVFLSAFLVLSSVLSAGTDPVWDDAVRVGVFVLIAVVIGELSLRRRMLIDTLEERVRERTAELQVRNEELDTFSRTVSHDLIGVLSTLHGYVQVAREAASGSENSLEVESIEAIGTLSLRMSHSIDELLEYARAGRTEGDIEMVEPSPLAGEVVGDLAGLVAEKHVEFTIAEGLPAVLVEEVKLKQVLSNLVANSIKHGAGDGTLHIEIGGHGDGITARLFVRDDGVGIVKEWQEEVFEDFKRLTRPGERPGLGLGLSIVKRAVEGWGGRVWLESAPGKGATFYFTAPLE